jgi:hypothetical protein
MSKITKPTQPHELPILQVTDEDALQYLEETYGKVGKVFFDWQKGLTKGDANEPYTNMRNLDRLVNIYQDGYLETQAQAVRLMLNVKEDDMQNLLVNLKQFEQTNSVVDKMQKIRGTQVVNPTDCNKSKPSN